jgi:peptide/nickel transport system substrate-binding protein
MSTPRIPRRAALLAPALLAAGGVVAQPRPRRGGTLTYATGTDATTLDPQFITDVPTSRTAMHIHETLVFQDQRGEMQPKLAETWTVSEDRRTWTFRLRRGVTFHDGTPFDAEAVRASFARILDPATGSPRRSVATVITEMRVLDSHTIALTTAQPFAPLLAQLSTYNLAILSPARFGAEGRNYARRPAGTGPFQLQAWQPGERITLSRFEGYWGERPNLDRIEIRVVPEDSARVLQILSGEADVIASVPPVMLPRLQGQRNVRVIREAGFRTVYIGLNARMKPWDDVRVRRAFAHAINADAIVSGVLRGVGTRGAGLEAPPISGAHRSLSPVPYDPTRARALLAEAGYPNGVDSVFFTPTGRYLNDRQIAEAVQAQAREAGFRLRLETPEWGAYQQMLDAGDRIPVFLLGKGSPSGDVDFTVTLLMHSEGRMNYFGFRDPRADQLIGAQRAATDPAERQRLLDELQDKFHDATVAVVLFYEDQLFATRANVQGVVVNPNEFVSFIGAWKE